MRDRRTGVLFLLFASRPGGPAEVVLATQVRDGVPVASAWGRTRLEAEANLADVLARRERQPSFAYAEGGA